MLLNHGVHLALSARFATDLGMLSLGRTDRGLQWPCAAGAVNLHADLGGVTGGAGVVGGPTSKVLKES